MTDSNQQIDLSGIPKKRGRPRIHENSAARQRAYRQRKKAQQAAAVAPPRATMLTRLYRWFCCFMGNIQRSGNIRR